MFLMECFYFYGVKHHRRLFHLILYSVLYYLLYKQDVVSLSYLPSTLGWSSANSATARHPKFNFENADRHERAEEKAIKYTLGRIQLLYIIESFSRA